MYVICGSMEKDKTTSRGQVLKGYVLYILDQSKREGVKGITCQTTWVTVDQYIKFDIDSLINSKSGIDIRYNRYGYVDQISKI